MYHQLQLLYFKSQTFIFDQSTNKSKNRSRNGRSRMPVIIGSPLINFFPGVRGDDERTLDEEVN
jgi:hypothetical protein